MAVVAAGCGQEGSDTANGPQPVEVAPVSEDAGAETALPGNRDRFAKLNITDSKWSELKSGVLMYGDRKNHAWTSIPPEFTEMTFSHRHAALSPVAEFEVTEDGWVFMAVTARSQLNPAVSADMPGLTPLAGIIEAGWERLPNAPALKGGSMDWIVYRRLCRAGEAFAYRTELYCAPLLLLRPDGGQVIELAPRPISVETKEKPESEPDGWAGIVIKGAVYKPIRVGEKMYSDRKQYFWGRVPAGMMGMSFLYGGALSARTEFEIVKDGWVYMAVTERSRNGKPGGDLPDLTPWSKIQSDGWLMQRRLGALVGADLNWVLFQRLCKEGEKFSYRTERYSAPMIITKP